MARWKLMTSHYVTVPGTEWEYTENDRITNKPKRHRFPVPMLLDPNDPACWTNKWGFKDNQEGEIIVCLGGRGETSDIIFEGDPTPDMMPIDDEARAISATFEERWRYKPETAPTDFSQSLVDEFQSEMAETETKPLQIEGLSELVAAITLSARQNQEVLEALTKQRRV